MLRRLILLCLLAAASTGVVSQRAVAAGGAPPCPDPRGHTLQSAHFLVSYNDDPAATGPVTQPQAGKILAAAERAYNSLTAMGFPAPLSIGGKTHIDIDDLSAAGLSSEYCNGAFVFDSSTIDSPDADYSVAFDVFGEIGLGQGVDIANGKWLLQGMASWAAWQSLGFPQSSVSDLGPWDVTLDCSYTNFTTQTCSKVGYENLGQSRWPFYEYLFEKYGVSFMKEVLVDTFNAGGNPSTGLSTALIAHGTTLGTEYQGFSTKLMVGGWTATLLNTTSPPVSGSPILTGAATGDSPTKTYGVNHLATKFVEIDRGDGDAKHKCYAATLTITVTVPSGVTSQPVFYWSAANSTPVSLTVSGTNATTTLPWDTCVWSTHGFLSLPNSTTNVDGALFQVSTHIDVSTTEVTATPPSTPANGYGNATDVNAAIGAPSISVFGPLVLTLPSTASQIELVVEASDEGSLGATLGSLDLGKSTLVPGENVVKFQLPKGALKRLRTSSAVGANVLTLTPTSSDGSAKGTPVNVGVLVVPAQKPAAKKPAKKKH